MMMAGWVIGVWVLVSVAGLVVLTRAEHAQRRAYNQSARINHQLQRDIYLMTGAVGTTSAATASQSKDQWREVFNLNTDGYSVGFDRSKEYEFMRQGWKAPARFKLDAMEPYFNLCGLRYREISSRTIKPCLRLSPNGWFFKWSVMTGTKDARTGIVIPDQFGCLRHDYYVGPFPSAETAFHAAETHNCFHAKEGVRWEHGLF